MAHTSVAAAHFAEGDFRVGSVISRSASILSRHFLTFFIVTVIAHSPMILLARTLTPQPTDVDQAVRLGVAWGLLGLVQLIVLGTLGEAVIVHAAFQDMQRRPVRLAESLNVALRRLLPILGFAFVAYLLISLRFSLLIIPGLILYTMWFVAFPAYVVERLGPWSSLRRSRELTKGHRWKLFGLALLLIIGGFGSPFLQFALTAVDADAIVALIGRLIWNGLWVSFASTVVAVAYHDLRVAKEGVDIDQIAGAFD